jgi:hypothetical protein
MRYLLLLSVLLLGTNWAAAQNYPSQGGTTHATSSGSTTTVEGCLSSNNGSYTLTDSHGNNIALTGDTSMLTEHVGSHHQNHRHNDVGFHIVEWRIRQRSYGTDQLFSAINRRQFRQARLQDL